jgi:NADH:ubiquinone oxidoreductase subunit F (NADH-binding)/(2Fe-2S) ferredoxin
MKQVLQRFFDIQKRIQEDYHLAHDQQQVVIQVGSATCERAAGADGVRAEFEKLVRASGRRDIEIKQTGCTGRCSREPIVGVFTAGQMPYKYERVTPAKVQQIFQQHVLGGQPVANLLLDRNTERLYSHSVIFCYSSYCNQLASKKGAEFFRERLTANGISPDTVRVFTGGCLGMCSPGQRGEVTRIMVFPERVIYSFKDEAELDRIIQSHFIEGKTCQELLATLDPLVESFLSRYGDVAFFNKQTRLTLRNSGVIDPESLEEYVVHSGFESLAQVLKKNDPGWVRAEMSRSGLRGRGGAGYLTGKKWQDAVDSNQDPVKYVVCNADEGDPGAFMDRSALEGDPFSIIEGMIIGAFAIGAHQGFMYIRAEYPLAIERSQKAIDKARTAGFLGKDILGSGFDFDLEIRLGAGAYVCGEETALLRSIEGRRGQPRIRPPYPTQAGLWGHPTVINNVETWANVPVIILHGADWFARIGTTASKGTKVFALAGKIINTGLVEVPMGTTLRDIIFEIGGGLKEGHSLKAIQTGGPSGGCIPANLVDTPVDYDSLAKAGSIMGSGGMIILDDQDCMVSTAKYFLEFTRSESCGKCVPCREGSLRMLEILERIVDGRGELEDLEKLERLAHLVRQTSLCGLGQNAPNPVLSALENFREEFIVHIRDKRCPTQKCSKLIRYEIDAAKCTGCTLCARRCPVPCISGSPKQPHLIDEKRCIKCGECFKCCKFNAVNKL